MPRTLTSHALLQLASQSSGDPALWLLQIYHDDMPQILRYVNDNILIVAKSLTFLPLNFEVTLASEEEEDATPELQLLIDNTERQFSDAIRSTSTPPYINLFLVFKSTPDIFELTIGPLELKGGEYDENQFTATLTINDILNTRYPGYLYNPGEFPGMF